MLVAIFLGILAITFVTTYFGGQTLMVSLVWTGTMALAMLIGLTVRTRTRPISPDKPEPPEPRQDSEISGS